MYLLYRLLIRFLIYTKSPIALGIISLLCLFPVIAPRSFAGDDIDKRSKLLGVRIVGIILLLFSGILWLRYFFIMSPERVGVTEEIIMMEFKEVNSPYELKFVKPYKAEIRCPEYSDRVLKRSFKHMSNRDPVNIADWLIMQAQVYFSKDIKAAKEKGIKRRTTKKPEIEEVQETKKRKRLAEADKLLQEASKYWAAADYNNSLNAAQKALEIKKELLGENHPEVLIIKNQVKNAGELSRKQGIPAAQNMRNIDSPLSNN